MDDLCRFGECRSFAFLKKNAKKMNLQQTILETIPLIYENIKKALR